MRTIRKNVALALCAVLLLMVAAMGFVGVSAHASTLDTFSKNDGMSTDFYQGFDWMGAWDLSGDILDGDKTLVRIKRGEWGVRWTNNYSQVLDGATFDADVYFDGENNMPVLYYTPKGAGEYWDGAGIGIYITEGANDFTLKVGRWIMNYGLKEGEAGNASKPKTLFYEATIAKQAGSDKTNIKAALAMNANGDWTWTLNIDGTDHVATIPAADWAAQVGGDEGWLGFAGMLNGSKNAVVKIVFNDYDDDNRKEYHADPDLADYFTALGEMKTAYEAAKAATTSTSLADVSDIISSLTVKKDLINSERNIRRYEKGRANWYYAEALAVLEETFKDAKDSYDLIQLGVAVNYFYDKAAAIETEDDVESAENLRKDVDADKLDDLVSLGLEGADDIMDKYDAAKANLADAKDGFVNEHITEFEQAVADLSTNDKIVAAADLQKYVLIINAKSANRDAYTARYNAASEILKGAIKGYAGNLADKWDIHNVTFVNANKYNEIVYSASDYYNDDATNDVGITLKGKLKLDGLSFEVTVNSGDYDKDSWFGFFFTKERSIFSISNHADTGLSESRGIITLVKPFPADEDVPAKTQIRMGYPNLYGNETDYDQCFLQADLYGNTIKYEFAKETIEEAEYYVCYITVTDEEEQVVVERFAARKLLASIVDAELDDEGMGYLTFGSCDKTLVGVKAVIHTINNEAAATVTGKVENGGNGNQGGDVPKPDDDNGKKKGGCGSEFGMGTASVLFAAAALAVAGVLVSRKRKATK